MQKEKKSKDYSIKISGLCDSKVNLQIFFDLQL